MNATNEQAETMLTPAEAAVRAKRSEYTLLRWIRDKRLAATRDPVNGRIRIRAADLDALLAGEPAAAPAE